MAVLMVALRFALDLPSLPELMADRLAAATPVEVFDFILDRLQVGAKPLLLAMLLAGQVVVGSAVGILYIRYSPSKIVSPGVVTPSGSGTISARIATGFTPDRQQLCVRIYDI